MKMLPGKRYEACGLYPDDGDEPECYIVQVVQDGYDAKARRTYPFHGAIVAECATLDEALDEAERRTARVSKARWAREGGRE